MDEIQITKDSKQLLAIIYKEYLSKINNGVAKSKAKLIGHSDDVCLLAPDWFTDDVVETMKELDRGGFIKNTAPGSTIYFSILLDKTIIYFENKNINTIKSVADWAFKLI